MERIVPMSQWNKILLIMSLACTATCLILDQCTVLTSLPIYVSILWTILITGASTWLSFFVLKMTLKANSPFYIKPVTPWITEKLENYFKLEKAGANGRVSGDAAENHLPKNAESRKSISENSSLPNNSFNSNGRREIKNTVTNLSSEANIKKLLQDIDTKFIDTWYNELSDDKTFKDEANVLLEKLLRKMIAQVHRIDELHVAHKFVNVFLLHMKEYRRALRRVEKGTATDVEEAFRCSHPGSRSSSALEHILHRLVTVLAGEFLQWELTSSLPCKLLLSVLAKRLFITLQMISCPRWIYEHLIALLRSAAEKDTENIVNGVEDSLVSKALGDGMASATAAVVPRPLPKSNSDEPTAQEMKENNADNVDAASNSRRESLSLDGLTPIGHRGLWANVNVLQVDSEGDEDRISPVYEEPTDFATTIARLRNVLEQKSTVTTPLQAEEKSYVVYEGNQFSNLAIPWTEFHTTADGSQQLLYCIQFDDIEQHGVDTFETTTATVKRQFSDFAHLHAVLEDIPAFSSIMSEIRLPEGGGRLDMENYLKTVCTRLSAESSPQLRHFLRPSSGSGKKADAVAPRLDRFLAKTVTGVFNTLRTVVPGFDMDQEEEVQPLPQLMPLADIAWRFVENTKAKSLAVDLQQLVAERIDYCSVDTAYEAVDSVESSGDAEMLALWWETVNTPYDEEVEELDCRLNLTSATIDLLCEILAGIGSNNTVQQEAVVRWLKLFFGTITEPIIQGLVTQFCRRLGNFSISPSVQIDNSDEPLAASEEKLLRLLEDKLIVDVKRIFGEDDTRDIIKFLVDSLKYKKINLDLSLQIIDVVASELLTACRLSYANQTS